MIKKIKILFIETVTNIGGGQIGLLDILENLDKKKFCPIAIVPSRSGNLYDALRCVKGVEICVFKFIYFPKLINTYLDDHPYLPIYSPFSVRKLAKKIKTLNPDLIHANQIFAGKYAAPAAQKACIPCIVTIRNVFYNKPFHLHTFVDTRLASNADRVVFNSNTGYSIFKARTKADNAMAIRNGIELEGFQNQKENLGSIKKRYHLPLDKKLLITIGRLSFAKGQAVLINALPKITVKHPDCHVAFVGDDVPGSGYKKTLLGLAKKLNVEKNISWIEFSDDIPSLYKIAYAIILPSILG